MPGMKPLAEFPEAARRRIKGVLFDIDDTLTTDGQMTPAAFDAMARLKDAGKITVPVTGRPAGWCDHMARMWPVDAIVGENGAFYFRYDHHARRMTRHYHFPDDVRRENRRRLESIAQDIVAAVPGSAIAADQNYRETDIAIDFCEDVKRLDEAAVGDIVARMEAAGLTAKISSIHVNGWFGGYDKLAMTRTLFTEVFAMDLDAERDSIAFLGDSPNDQPMFAHFPNAIGVANIRNFAAVLTAPPAYVTEREAGGGFAEAVKLLLGG